VVPRLSGADGPAGTAGSRSDTEEVR